MCFMLCVLHCHPDQAEKVMEVCRCNIGSDILRDAFIFTCDRMKRYKGSWHIEKRELFPDVVFVETGDLGELSKRISCCEDLLSPREDGSLVGRIAPDEESFLRKLCGSAHHLSMSQGYIRDGKTYVVEGPLAGMERRIRKIDRHKRIAAVLLCQAEGSPKKQGIAQGINTLGETMMVGLEIVSKS